MKLLVTGGAGFIGTNYIHHVLAKTDHEVVCLDLLTYAGNRLSVAAYEDNDRFTLVQGDICDQDLVADIIATVDLIVHFAAESHVDRSIAGAQVFAHTNIVGTVVLLEAALKHGTRFHHVSTDEVFGSLDDTGFFTEKTSYQPRSPYAASKAGSDHFVRSFYHTYGLPITVTNCSNNFGPYQHPEKLIPKVITNAIQNKPIPLYGSGKNVRDWLFVGDHIRGIQAVLENGEIGETYCLGGDRELSNHDMVQAILKILNQSDDLIQYVSDRKGHDWRYAIDHSKATEELGWMPNQDFEKNLQDTVAWYINNEDWWRSFETNNAV